jgi:hypothetical protein
VTDSAMSLPQGRSFGNPSPHRGPIRQTFTTLEVMSKVRAEPRGDEPSTQVHTDLA